MSDLSAAQFRSFMRGPFSDSIRKAYKSHQILCEADLQSFAWYRIRQFLKKVGGSRGKFRVLNKPFLRKSKTYPDLVVFKDKTPWAVIELKENRKLPEKTALTEREKLRLARESYAELKRDISFMWRVTENGGHCSVQRGITLTISPRFRS